MICVPSAWRQVVLLLEGVKELAPLAGTPTRACSH